MGDDSETESQDGRDLKDHLVPPLPWTGCRDKAGTSPCTETKLPQPLPSPSVPKHSQNAAQKHLEGDVLSWN